MSKIKYVLKVVDENAGEGRNGRYRVFYDLRDLLVFMELRGVSSRTVSYMEENGVPELERGNLVSGVSRRGSDVFDWGVFEWKS